MCDLKRSAEGGGGEWRWVAGASRSSRHGGEKGEEEGCWPTPTWRGRSAWTGTRRTGHDTGDLPSHTHREQPARNTSRNPRGQRKRLDAAATLALLWTPLTHRVVEVSVCVSGMCRRATSPGARAVVLARGTQAKASERSCSQTANPRNEARKRDGDIRLSGHT